MPDRVLVDGQGYTAVPHAEDELLRELADIDAQASKQGQPLIATIYADRDADDPPLLSIGLGGNESILVYSSGHWNNESGFSKRPRTGDATEITFRYGTGHSEYLGWMIIPKTPRTPPRPSSSAPANDPPPSNVETSDPGTSQRHSRGGLLQVRTSCAFPSVARCQPRLRGSSASVTLCDAP